MANTKTSFTKFSIIILLMICGICKAEISKQFLNLNVPTSRVLTNEQWITDLEELYINLKTKHRDLYHSSKPEQFEKLYIQIKTNISSLSDKEIIVQFSRLVALVNDGHTRLTLPLQEGIGLNQAHSKTPLPSDAALMFRHLPIEFYWFDDGIYVIKATKQYADLIGKKVLKINETPIDLALKNVRKMSHYDNESGYRLIAASKLGIIEILESLKIIKNNAPISISFEKGGVKKVILTPLDQFTKVDFLEKKMYKEVAVLSRQKNDVYYWYQHISDKNAIYLQINQINAAESGPGLIKFMGNLDKFIKENGVDRIILDLRNNFGGSNSYSRPIVNLILNNASLNKIGSFYTLIGRKTFSAAQYLVNDLSKWTNVVFVGEPTGASPSHYGDSKKFQLSNSNLTVRISSIYWRDWSSNEFKQATSPDIPIKTNAVDYFKNTDIALSTCLNFKASEKLVDTYISLYETGGMETAERLYLRLVYDYNQEASDISSVEKKLVEWISEGNKQ